MRHPHLPADGLHSVRLSNANPLRNNGRRHIIIAQLLLSSTLDCSSGCSQGASTAVRTENITSSLQREQERLGILSHSPTDGQCRSDRFCDNPQRADAADKRHEGAQFGQEAVRTLQGESLALDIS